MNTGVIAVRYARALMKYVEETGTGERTYVQISGLVSAARALPSLGEGLTRHRELSLEKKLSLMESALGEPLEDSILRLIRLVHVQGRMEYMLRIMLAFIRIYRLENGVHVGRLVTAVPLDAVRDSVEKELGEKTGVKVSLEFSTDPSVIGGFILDLDGYRLDASVRGRLARIRKELVDETDRLV